MLGVRLPDDLDRRLGALAKKTHRTKSYYVKEAIASYLDSYENVYKSIADYEDEKKKGALKLHSLDDVMNELGIDQNDLDAAEMDAADNEQL